jgi:hypothetical protein
MRRLWKGLVLSVVVLAAPAAGAEVTRRPNILIVGEQAVSTRWRHHLTTRNRVADFACCPRESLLAYVSPSSGRVIVGLVGWPFRRPITTELPGSPGSVAWSGDGVSLLVSTSGKKGESAALWLVRVPGTGPEATKMEPRRIFSAAEIGSFACSPKAERVAVACRQLPQRPGEEGAKEIVVLNLRDDSRQSLGEWGEGLSFDASGRLLSYQAAEQQPDGSTTSCQVVYDVESGEKKRREQRALEDSHASPDGARIARAITGAGTDLIVRDLTSGEGARLTWNRASKFAAWSPDSQIVAYIRGYPVTDDRRETVATVPTLWLAAAAGPDAGRQMFVGPVDADSPVKWSGDGQAVAFLADGDLCAADVSRGSLRVRDRIALGLPVTEEAIRQEAVTNAKQIALALVMYAADHDLILPPSGADIAGAIGPYLKSPDVFYHPAQPDQLIFNYSLPQETNLADIVDPAKTVVGVLDLGGGWEVVCYADGHVTERRK